MNYPLQFRAKIVALAPQIHVTDATGASVCYVKQKLFKFKEQIEIFRDPSRKELVAKIGADRVIDWSARYSFSAADGSLLGAVGRKGMRSIWKASYEAFTPQATTPTFHLQEENVWAKVFDSLLGSIPVLGILGGYFFHPKYLATRAADNSPAMRLTKQPAFFEGVFTLEKLSELSAEEELNLLLAFLMLNLLERERG
jgi:hypothetical protein